MTELRKRLKPRLLCGSGCATNPASTLNRPLPLVSRAVESTDALGTIAMPLSGGQVAQHSISQQAHDPEVWVAQVSDHHTGFPELNAALTTDEKIHRDRFLLRPDQQRFLVGRAWLRIMLGGQLNVPPANVPLRYGAQGKPFISSDEHPTPIQFNVAHSGDFVLLAFHGSCELGVDIEQLTDRQDWDDVAQTVFPAEQYRAWAALEANERKRAFFQEWTRREAGLKAIGCGFAIEQPAEWNSRLTFFDVELPPGYAGSVAVLPAR